MTRDELIAECKHRSAGGEDVEIIVGYLRTSGCSKVDSIALLNATYGIGLAEAKKIVHFSPIWVDTKASDENFHEAIAEALTKSHPGDVADNARNALLLFADVNNHMMTIRETLASNPAIASATRSCDVRQYRDLHCFESYVEAETRAGTLFCWTVEIHLTSQGWEIQRQVAKQTRDGGQPEIQFDHFMFETFDGLASSVSGLMAEFVESAKNFDDEIR
jgi:hypothetical protein